MAAYLQGETEAYTAANLQIFRETTGEDQVKARWATILLTYFTHRHAFYLCVTPENYSSTRNIRTLADIMVLRHGPEHHDVLVVSASFDGGPSELAIAVTQACGYIRSLRKPNHPTLGIITKGTKFRMYRIGGLNEGHEISVLPVGQADPNKVLDIIDDSLELESTLLRIREDAMLGRFNND